MRAAGTLALVAALAGDARADRGVGEPDALTIPTASTAPTTTAVALVDLDHRGGAGAAAVVRYARLVDLDVRRDADLARCDRCRGADHDRAAVRQLTAGWKLTLPTWTGGAIAGGARVPLAGAHDRATEAFAVLSQRLGPVRLHLGASTWASAHRGADGEELRTAALAGLRPLLGLAWTPAIYPRTTLLTELQWLPQLGPTAADTGPRWSLAWGVRYRALRWSAIELGVHHREGDDLGDATVQLRWSAWTAARR